MAALIEVKTIVGDPDVAEYDAQTLADMLAHVDYFGDDFRAWNGVAAAAEELGIGIEYCPDDPDTPLAGALVAKRLWDRDFGCFEVTAKAPNVPYPVQYFDAPDA